MASIIKKILKYQQIEKTTNLKNINNHQIAFLIKNYIILISYCEEIMLEQSQSLSDPYKYFFEKI